VPIHLPLVPTPGKDLFFPPALHFLKAYIDSPKRFCLSTSACIYCAFIKLTPSLLTCPLSSHFPNIQQLTVHYIISIYRWVVSIFFIQYFSFYLLLQPPLIPSDSLSNIILLSLSLYTCMYTYTHIYMIRYAVMHTFKLYI
jgi:hypothetical protein